MSGFPGADFAASLVEETLVVKEADFARGFEVEGLPERLVHREGFEIFGLVGGAAESEPKRKRSE